MATKFDLNLMLVLEAIYDEGNTTRAAKTLFLSQSAVSHSLGRLRELYDDPLFVRRGQVMAPTPLTQRIINQVKDGLHEIRRSVNEADNFNPADQKHVFHLGLRDIIETALMPQFMSKITEIAPDLSITSQQMTPAEVEALLAQGKLDAVVETVMPMPDTIKNIRVFSESFVVIARKDHPALKHALTIEEYLSHKHVVVSLKDSGPEWIDNELVRRGLRRDIALRCQHFFSAGYVVMNTNFIATVPKAVSKFLSKDLDIGVANLPFQAPSIDVCLYWHQRNHEDSANCWLRQQIIQGFQDLSFVNVERTNA